MDGEELDKACVVLFADAFQIQDLSEILLRPVRDVDEVGLHEGFGRKGSHLEGFEEWVQAREG